MRTAVPIGTVLRLQETPNPVRNNNQLIIFFTSNIYFSRIFH
jgi:hypothetical protein